MMMHRAAATAVLVFASALAVDAVTTNLTTTKTDPTNITIPDIPQTTSQDPATECQYYQSPFTVNPAEWPSNWDIATSNGMNTTQEFQNLYNSIDWSKAPNIPVRKLTADGGLDLTGYDTQNDPDCWWSASQCTTPKTQGIYADIVACAEPETWGLVSEQDQTVS